MKEKLCLLPKVLMHGVGCRTLRIQKIIFIQFTTAADGYQFGLEKSFFAVCPLFFKAVLKFSGNSGHMDISTQTHTYAPPIPF